MKLEKVWTFLTLVVLSLGAYGGTWTEEGEVEVIYLHSSLEGALVRRGAMFNPDNCPNNDFFFLSKTNPNFNELYSVLLAAKMAGKPVRVWVGGCEGSRPELQHAQI